MRCCKLGREGENGDAERKQVLKRGSTLVDFDRWSKSTQSIFGYCKWPYQHKVFLDIANGHINRKIF
jgi:hypothetical protein